MLYVKWLPNKAPLPVFGHRFETQQGYTFAHTSEMRLEICRCDVGGAQMRIAGQPIESRPGDITVWPPTAPLHITTPPQHAHTTVAFAVEDCELLDEEQARSFVMAQGGVAGNGNAAYCLLPLHFPKASSSVSDLLGRTVAAVRRGDATSRLCASGLFLLLCEEITSTTVRQLAAPGTTSAHANHCRRVMEYIAAHYREDFSVDAVAQAVGLTPNYLCTLFKRTVGVTPVQYITQYRIGVAKELLLTTVLPVCEVAASVGFDDAAYFCRVFKNSEKMSPSQWRAAK